MMQKKKNQKSIPSEALACTKNRCIKYLSKSEQALFLIEKEIGNTWITKSNPLLKYRWNRTNYDEQWNENFLYLILCRLIIILQ